MKIGGKFSVEPLFSKNYMLAYNTKDGVTGGVAQILKYYDEIDYLGEYNQQITFDISSPRFFAYSLVYINSAFGAIYKQADSPLLYKITIPNMDKTLV